MSSAENSYVSTDFESVNSEPSLAPIGSLDEFDPLPMNFESGPSILFMGLQDIQFD